MMKKTGIDSVSQRVLLALLEGSLLDSSLHEPGDSQQEGLLYEPDPPYGGAEQVALLEAGELVRLYRAVRDRMAELGMDPDRFEPPVQHEPEVLRITGRYRIFLPERGGEELRLRPLVKTVFIFFLKHPEGIAAKGIGAFRSELLSIYSRITGREDAEAVAATVDRLVDVMENSFHENCSRLNTRLAACFPEGTLDQYQVRGARSGLRRIALEPMYVRWEEP